MLNTTKTLRDIMQGQTEADIYCAVQNMIVRKLKVVDDQIVIDALTEAVTVPLDTQITYQPWTFDRGSMLFSFNGRQCKLCTEGDIIQFHTHSAEIQP